MGKYKIDENGVLTVTSEDKIIGDINFIEKEDRAKVTKIIVPEGVEEIKDNTFQLLSHLKEVELPNSLIKIGRYAFYHNLELTKVKFGNGLKFIDEEAFASVNIKSIDLPDSVEEIKSFAFRKAGLRSVKMPKALKAVEVWAFADCEMLSNVELNEGLERIDLSAFSDCCELKEVVLPKTVKVVTETVMNNYNFKHVVLPMTAFIGSRVMSNLTKKIKKSKEAKSEFKCDFVLDDKVISSNDVKYMSSSGGKTVYEYGQNGDVIIIKKGEEPIKTNKKEIYKGATKWNHLNEVSFRYVNRLLDWNLKYDVLPHKSVVMNMPKSDIDLFYKNNNAKNWARIVKSCTLTEDANKDSLFELAYALGVFSENGKESKEATDFIIDAVISNYDEFAIHSKFSGLGVYTTKYNPNFAKFFMANFKKNPNFLTAYNPMADGTFNFCAMAYREFNNILKAFPNKKIITRQDNDRLTPELVISYFTEKRYEDVATDAQDLAKVIGKYGYSQEDYKKIEEWYLAGLKVQKAGKQVLNASKDFMVDVVKDLNGTMGNVDGVDKVTNLCVSEEPECVDNEYVDSPDIVENEMLIDLGKLNASKVITYEMLDKANANGAVLGNMTNCCQVLNGAGESCLKYGMTEPNSGFVAFKNGEKLIGQAWVWYDEEEKIVCLDNIEVPTNMLDNLMEDEALQKEFINCLIRLKNGIEKSMGKENVSKVTIGLGYNDISKLLDANFKKDKNAKKLSNYNGYTDASRQFIIEDKQQKMNSDKKIKEEKQK